MSEVTLEKEIWFFPIHKYGTKKYIPMIYALPLAYLIPTLFIILLSPFSYNNALLFQIEYILVALFYGLLGILTRSKLRSLLNIIPVILSYLTVQFVVQGLMNFNPPINDPYATFNVASEPIANILSNPNFGIANADQIAGLLFVIDIFIIFLIAEIGGFFTAMISTGFWNPKGQFSVIAVIAKIIAIPIALIFIIVLPLMLHGISSLVAGGSYLGAGVSELSLAFGGGVGGHAAQSLDDIDIGTLTEHSIKAAKYFKIADDKLGQLKGNIILGGIISQVMASNPDLKGFENISNALDLVGSISEVSYVLPELFQGFKALQKGFEQTLPYITEATNDYNPIFANGLIQLTYAFDNFSLAWEKSDSSNSTTHGLKKAISIASSLKDIAELSNYVNINQFISALDTSITGLISMNTAFIQFLNGTYETTIAMVNLGENNLVNTNFWMNAAIDDFILSNTTLSAIPTPPPVSFELYPNGDGGATDKTEIAIPIDGVVNIAKDLNNLLIRFAYGGLASINLFDAMDEVMTSMDNLNWNDTVTTSSSAYWDGLTNGLLNVQNHYYNGLNNLTEAGTLATTYSTKSYGQLLDPIFVTGEGSFFNTLGSQISELSGNFTDFGFVLQGFTNTTFAFRDFSYGSNLFASWFQEYNTTVVSNTALLNMAKANFTTSQNFAHDGYLALDQAMGLNPQVKSSWMSSLYDEINLNTANDHSLYGANQQGITAIDLLLITPTNTQEWQLIINLVAALNLADILGSG
jgi:hypothetical protein